jgi:dTDP-4-dehydrorhamnose reductase
VRVLVTGSAGMLGYALRECAPAGVELLEGDLPALDIRDRAAVERALAAGRAQAVINAAAYTDVDGCESHEADALAVNGTGAGNVAAACAAAGIPLLHLSTDYVFVGRIPAPGEYGEEDAVAPLSAYGRTKLAGERAVSAAGGTHWIVRTQWLYGLRGKNFVETMLRLAAERDTLSVVDDQIGSPTSTHDLAPQLWRILQQRPPSGVYHATNTGACSWFGFAAEIFRQSGARVVLKPTDSRSLGRPAPRPARSVLSNARMRAALVECLPRWEDALSRYLARRATGASR